MLTIDALKLTDIAKMGPFSDEFRCCKALSTHDVGAAPDVPESSTADPGVFL